MKGSVRAVNILLSERLILECRSSKLGAMLLAIISDIHANLEALTDVFEAIDRERVQEIICLGDVVGYGANPNECATLVQQRCAVTVLGNHDAAALDTTEAQHFTDRARIAIEWTAEQLTAETKSFLGGLGYTTARHGAFFVHASPYQPQRWQYIFDEYDAEEAFGSYEERLCFIGHTHTPGIYSPEGREKKVVPEKKMLVNVGSVGQPRDGNPLASFGLLDTEAWEYRNVRVKYDIGTAAQKIRKAGLPSMLADRLSVGI